MVQKITLLPSNLKKVEFFHTFRETEGIAIVLPMLKPRKGDGT
jgi:hypothetical protein